MYKQNKRILGVGINSYEKICFILADKQLQTQRHTCSVYNMDISTHKLEKIMDIQYFNTSFEIRDTYLFCSYYLQLFGGGTFIPPDQKVINAVLRT